jgi:hypothetical protein
VNIVYATVAAGKAAPPARDHIAPSRYRQARQARAPTEQVHSMQYPNVSVARAPRDRAPRVVAAVAAVVAALAALLATPARATPGQLEVDFLANGRNMRCAAEDVSFQRTTVTRVSWRCVGSSTRFRCNMTSAGSFATDVDLVALNCNALTEVPASAPPTLIQASGFEST